MQLQQEPYISKIKYRKTIFFFYFKVSYRRSSNYNWFISVSYESLTLDLTFLHSPKCMLTTRTFILKENLRIPQQ